MRNRIMCVNFFDREVRCETEGLLVCANDLMIAGNRWRTLNGLPLKNLKDVTGTQAFTDFKAAVSKVKGIPDEELYRAVTGRNGRTMVYIHLAIYIAQQISPEFHVTVVDTFVNGKLLEFRELGGTEFVALNAAIDAYLPGGDRKDNKGVYITVAKKLRARILKEDQDWSSAGVDQTHCRYSFEKRLVDYLSMRLVKDFEHLKELIDKL